ncbi:glycosyltransferase [bacterium]|nr:glycosyltransferase [bacterium]
MQLSVIIPALNEEKAIGKVVKGILAVAKEARVVVSDNGSTDCTAQEATKAGAIVVHEAQKGYGYACLRAMKYLQNEVNKPDVILFMDGDFADYPEDIPRFLEEIANGADLVVGSRKMGHAQKGALTWPQRFGNALTAQLIQWRWGTKVTDLGPFRAIKWDVLQALNMQEKTFGWTIEMQVKAIKNQYKYIEIPVDYKVRIGTSKVSGNFSAAIKAGFKILSTLYKYAI